MIIFRFFLNQMLNSAGIVIDWFSGRLASLWYTYMSCFWCLLATHVRGFSLGWLRLYIPHIPVYLWDSSALEMICLHFSSSHFFLLSLFQHQQSRFVCLIVLKFLLIGTSTFFKDFSVYFYYVVSAFIDSLTFWWIPQSTNWNFWF